MCVHRKISVDLNHLGCESFQIDLPFDKSALNAVIAAAQAFCSSTITSWDEDDFAQLSLIIKQVRTDYIGGNTLNNHWFRPNDCWLVSVFVSEWTKVLV